MQVAALPRPAPLHGAGALALRRPSRIIIIDDSDSSEEVTASRTLRGGGAVAVEDEVEEVTTPVALSEHPRIAGGDHRAVSLTSNESNGIANGIELLNNRDHIAAATAFPADESQSGGIIYDLKHIATPVDREALVFGEDRSQANLASGSREGDCSSRRTCAPTRRKCSAVRDYPVGCGKNLANSQPNGDMMTRRKSYESEVAKESSKPFGDHSANLSTRSGLADLNIVWGADPSTNYPTKSLLLESSIEVPCFDKEIDKVNMDCRGNSDINKRLPIAGPRVQRADGSFNHKRNKLRHLGQLGKGQKRIVSRNTILSTRGHPGSDMALTTKKAKLLRTERIYDRKQMVSRPVINGCKGSVHFADSVKETRGIETNYGVSARALVKQTLHDFESIRRTLLKEQTCKRPDLESARILRIKGRWRNCEEKIIGEVPGVEVGDQFIYRIEMLTIGLHRQVQGGIDFIPGSTRSSGRPIATSIVASGGYEDDDDCGDTFVYTGQGGNNYNGDRRQQQDQTLVRGNLAMSNSHIEKIPVRVIRGSPDAASPTDKMYTYDGLYDVVDFWKKPGLSGFAVYQFKLTRRPGQPELGSSIVNFVGKLKKKGIARPYLLLEDISEGRERLPISVVNEVDDESQPDFFNYIRYIKKDPSCFLPGLPTGCDCVGGCVDEKKCFCAAKNGGEFPYNEAGYILRDKSVVFECGSSCRCSSTCHNRTSQRGIRYQLEIFKTKNRGWGVRSLDSIRPGGFICEYTGELLSDADAELRTGSDEYLFDIGNKPNSWGDVSELMGISASTAVVPLVEDAGYTIDAKQYGNVARFINHSCSPNLFAQNVVFDSDDLRTPHVMLFAMENIPPMREFTYDYNYSIGHVWDVNGNVKTKSCFCGAADCQGRLY